MLFCQKNIKTCKKGNFDNLSLFKFHREYMKESIKQITTEFFEKLGVDYSNLEINEEAEKIFLIHIKSTDSSILIWPHGKNIEVLRSILKLLAGKKLWEHVMIHLEINDYMKQKEEKLFSYINSKIEYVKSSGTDIKLPFFTAYERKKIHSYIWEKWGNVYTKSIGEWAERRIHLCKKTQKWLSI